MKKTLLLALLLCSLYCQNTSAQISKRWYSYFEYLDQTTGGDVSYTSLGIWNDANSMEVYSGPTFDTNNILSLGMSFAPRLDAWDDVSLFGSTIKVGTADAFTIDSVRIYGIYMRNNAKPLVKDTLRLSFVYGDGTTASNLPSYSFTSSAYPLASYLGLPYDAIKNMATRYSISTPAAYVQTIILSNTDTASFFERGIALTTPLVVPAGNFAAMSISFRSGDASFVPYDTVRFSGAGPYKYGSFRPLIGYHSFSPGSAAYASYNPVDSNVGYGVYKPFSSPVSATRYAPTWAWTSGGGPSVLQYPIIDFHLTCPTCKLNDNISSGTTTICVGDATAMIHSAPGGTWSSSSPAIATVGIMSGVVSGISGGTATITYAISSNYTTTVVTIDPLPSIGTITGPSSVCLGASVTLAGTPSLGTWSATSGNVGVSSAGVATGSSVGTDLITYEVSNSCGTSFATKPMTVITVPAAGTTYGSSTVCIGSNITLTNSEAGGSWSASNGNAAVSGGGVVAGIAAGTVSITYTVTNPCGSAANEKIITVVNCPPSGIEDIPGTGSDISIFPNPTSGNFNIKSAELISNVVVSNMIGQKVFAQAYNTTDVTISLAQLPKGVYFVRVNDSTTLKVTKQ